ncbi:hypothetical protein [Streptomyces sp. NPDC059468]|uniref:hypothetical protein n=1 Tax=Streptomyces sp. NPDC059468 TaxID=3346845 RepID=UPI003679FA84
MGTVSGRPGPADARDLLEHQAGPPGGDATRHLCAAAFLDRTFRQAAIRELVEEQHRVPAASPGVDMAAVLAACLRARWEGAVAGGLIILVAFVGLLTDRADFALALLVVLLVRAVTWSFGPFIGKGRFDRGTLWRLLLRRGLAALGLCLLFSAGLLLLVIAAIGQGLSSTTTGVPPDSGGVVAQGATWNPSLLGIAAFLLAWVAIGAVLRYRRHLHLAALHEPGGTEPGPQSTRLSPVFARLQERPAEAETLYSDFSPFVGAGLRLEHEGWSFPIELRPSTQQRNGSAPLVPLELPTLHRSITAAVAELSQGDLYPGDFLHHLTVRDRVFRAGRRPDAPENWYGALSVADPLSGVQTLAPAWADLLDLGSHERIRHFLEVRAELWQRQLVAALFLRANVQGGLLQVEGLAFLLPPVAERYRVVDDILPPRPLEDGGHALWRAVRSFALDVCTAAVEPWAILRSAVRTAARRRWYRRMHELGRPVDHSPQVSLRELGAEPYYQQLFQELDVRRFFTSIRERAFTAVLAELRRAGYDTSEFEQAVQLLVAGNMNISTGIQNVNSPNSGNQAVGRVNNLRQTKVP